MEEEAVLAALTAISCDTAQGYIVSRPVAAAAIATFLAAEVSALATAAGLSAAAG